MATEIIQMSADGNLNCGFDSADGEKVQISGYV